MFEKLLVCLDGSRLAEQILPQATEAALCFKSKVILLNVVAPATAQSEVEAAKEVGTQAEQGIRDKIQREESAASAYLKTIAAPLKEKGLNVECVTFEDTVDTGIINYAKSNGIGLIAIATHGRSGLTRTTLGSIADAVIRESGLPVLVIKPMGN